jgi:hypothetical protein
MRAWHALSHGPAAQFMLLRGDPSFHARTELVGDRIIALRDIGLNVLKRLSGRPALRLRISVFTIRGQGLLALNSNSKNPMRYMPL